MQSLPPGVSPGCLVHARGCEWRVAAIVDHDDCRELHLRDAGGDARILLWPFDRPSPATRPRVPRVRKLAAWAKEASAILARTIDPRLPRARFHGDVLPYQLAPAAAMASGVSRVLLADEVGLGKTIQAGWIVADLLSREPDARVLIAVPAGLRDQWSSELRRFFGLDLSLVDAAWLRASVADRAADVSPWAAPGVYAGSIDFLKRQDVARSLTDAVWDLLIVDEAHTATAPTERHAALASVAALSRRLVLVTATPYSGDPAGFASMIALGARPGDGEPVMFRRAREEAGDARRRRHRFATVRIGRAEFRLQRLLERYTRDVWREASADAENARLAMTILRKRALSSAAAALRSLVRRQELLRSVAPVPRQRSLFDEDAAPDEDLPDTVLAAPGFVDRGREDRWLTALVEAASRAAGDDSKTRRLGRLIARIGGAPIIVFTEYRDTLTRLAEAMPAALLLHGGLTASERAAVQRRFNERGGILLATDAAAEGLNLQQRCRLVVNYELPWNPARLEQRIGRVDRIGQRRTVHAISLVARDTAEDLVVAALARRLARVAATLGQRDRLASFLTDARTARCVIASETLDPPDHVPAAPAVARPAAGDYPVDRIAAALRSGLVTTAPPGFISVGSARARGAIAPGCVVLVRLAAVTGAGTIAERPLAVHLPDSSTSRPLSRAAVRARAGRAIAVAEREVPRLAEAREWFEQVNAVHRGTLSARAAREAWLRRGAESAPELQPGLFDRRAAIDLERRLDAAARRRRDHDRRLTAFGESLQPRLECTAAAALVAWR